MIGIPPELIEQLRAEGYVLVKREQLLELGQLMHDTSALAAEVCAKVDALLLKEANRRAKIMQKRNEQRKKTIKRVLELTKGVKWKHPHYPKTEVARKIARSKNAPCGFEHAKDIIDAHFDREMWENLGFWTSPHPLI